MTLNKASISVNKAMEMSPYFSDILYLVNEIDCKISSNDAYFMRSMLVIFIVHKVYI